MIFFFSLWLFVLLISTSTPITASTIPTNASSLTEDASNDPSSSFYYEIIPKHRTFIDPSLINSLTSYTFLDQNRYPTITRTPKLYDATYVHFTPSSTTPYYLDLSPHKRKLVLVNLKSHDIVRGAFGKSFDICSCEDYSPEGVESFLATKGFMMQQKKYGVLVLAYNILMDSGVAKVFLTCEPVVYSYYPHHYKIEKFRAEADDYPLIFCYDW